jgi:hypothetical protein
MDVQELRPEIVVPIEGDVYVAQRRPAHRQIVINDDYRGIKLVEPRTGRELPGAPVPDGFRSSGVIDAWCFRADGGSVLVMSNESRAAALISLEAGGHSVDLIRPPFKTVSDIRYLWEGDSLWMAGGKSFGFFQLVSRDGEWSFQEVSSMVLRRAHPHFRRAVDRLPIGSCNVLRVEPDERRLAFHEWSGEPGRIGVMSYHDETAWSVPVDGEVPRLAFHGDSLFVLQEYEVLAIDRRGAIEARYPASEGFSFVDLDTLPGSGDEPARLVLVCSDLGNPRNGRALIYRL